jgi:hypothetical protein
MVVVAFVGHLVVVGVVGAVVVLSLLLLMRS